MKKKACPKCRKRLSLTEGFYGTSSGAHCKDCVRAAVRANRDENIEHYREYDRERAMRPDRVAARRAYAKTPKGKRILQSIKDRWAERNAWKKAANITLNNAVRDRRVTKQPCEVCGSARRIHGHHDDYTKALEVRWLCPKHHTEHHKAQP